MAVRKVTIDANVAWRWKLTESGRWIGVCDQLNIAVEAESEEELRSLIPEALHLLMKDLLEDNELEQYLRERGWYAADLPAATEAGAVEFDVPWHLIAGNVRDPEHRPH